jgi:MFS family permease
MSTHISSPIPSLTNGQCYGVLVTAFLGWMFAGTTMVVVPMAGRSATVSFGILNEGKVGQWFAYYVTAFLLGAAAGGLLFGHLGDRLGRAKAMGLSILWYSSVSALLTWVDNPWAFMAVVWLYSLGIGGMWPNGVSLVSEAWPDVSRPLLAGLIGTAANIGFVFLGVLGSVVEISPDHWRWVTLVTSAPLVLGLIVLFAVAESPRWLTRKTTTGTGGEKVRLNVLWRGPYWRRTLIGIALGAVPLLGRRRQYEALQSHTPHLGFHTSNSDHRYRQETMS